MSLWKLRSITDCSSTPPAVSVSYVRISIFYLAVMLTLKKKKESLNGLLLYTDRYEPINSFTNIAFFLFVNNINLRYTFWNLASFMWRSWRPLSGAKDSVACYQKPGRGDDITHIPLKLLHFSFHYWDRLPAFQNKGPTLENKAPVWACVEKLFHCHSCPHVHLF